MLVFLHCLFFFFVKSSNESGCFQKKKCLKKVQMKMKMNTRRTKFRQPYLKHDKNAYNLKSPIDPKA